MNDKLKEFFAVSIPDFFKSIKRGFKNGAVPSPVTIAQRISLDSLCKELFQKAYEQVGTLDCVGYVTSEPVSFSNKTVGDKVTLKVGDKWAQEVFDCAWFHISGKVPQGIKPEELVFLIDTGGEGLVCDRDGVEKQGLTCKASQFDFKLGMPGKRVVIPDGLVFDGEIDFWIDAGANDLFGNMKSDAKIGQLSICKLHSAVRMLAYDLQVLCNAYDVLPKGEVKKHLLDNLKATKRELGDITDEECAELHTMLLPIFNEGKDTNAFTTTAVGHAHLDLAWLWPLRESKRKGARTFTSQILNIKRYPDYVFGASQAQLYQWMKDGYPRIYQTVKELAATPNWEVQGATWVEMDSNLTSGESLLRQLYYGKKFFRDEFGQEMEVLWLPDSFGYSACLPQVMRLAHVPYFLTQKMSWNTVNRFPYHTFYWNGLDGSRVFAHMLPENTYNSRMTPEFLTFAEQNYSERSISKQAIQLFGIGDGGGGPGFEHIERAERLKSLNGVPHVKMRKAIECLREMDDGQTPYPTHSGELYLEKHQGTYTTHGKNKYFNRRMEFALRNYEWLAFEAEKNGIELPLDKSALEEIWKEVLLYQFHDILPGSSINRVYDESVARYRMLSDRVNSGIKKLLDSLLPKDSILNFSGMPLRMPVKHEDKWYDVNLAPLSAVTLSQLTPLSTFHAQSNANSIQNDKVRVVFENGCIVSLFVKSNEREYAVPRSPMNVFSAYTDNGDGWDIVPVNYQSSKRNAVCKSFSTAVDGAKAYATVRFMVDNIGIEQEIFILDGSSQVNFRTNVMFVGKSVMLRVAFPVAVNAPKASFNVQFGHLYRNTTENNSVEKAQYEVSGQKFVDLSDKDGISLINDCKYGYRVKGNVIDMDIVRSPKNGPSHNVDQGMNKLSFALVPHEGSIGSATYEAAYLMNNPPIIGGTATETLWRNRYSTDNTDIVLESAKMSEDGKGIILRLYNSTETKQDVRVHMDDMRPYALVGVMEDELEKTDGKLSFNPFELKLIEFI